LPEKNLILIKGSVPGPNKKIVEVKSAFMSNSGSFILTKKVQKSLVK
jgi:hypothetical protein